MKALLSWFAIAVLADAPPVIAQSTLTAKEQALVDRLQQDVNRRFLVKFPEQRPVFMCPSAIDRFDQCKRVSHGWFVVESISLQHGYPVEKPTIYRSKFYFVRFDDGTSGYIPVSERPSFLTEEPEVTLAALAASQAASRQSCEERGYPKLNMTKEEVVATCWGTPRRVFRSRVALTREYTIYDRGRFLTFENGRLVAIH